MSEQSEITISQKETNKVEKITGELLTAVANLENPSETKRQEAKKTISNLESEARKVGLPILDKQLRQEFKKRQDKITQEVNQARQHSLSSIQKEPKKQDEMIRDSFRILETALNNQINQTGELTTISKAQGIVSAWSLED